MLAPILARRRQRGAALLLLLVVVSLGASALLINIFSDSKMEAIRTARSNTRLTEAREALLGYALTHGRLPRPATSARDGRENPRPCGNDTDCTGLLPWVTLGVEGADSWGKMLRYSVTPGYTADHVLSYQVVADKKVLRRLDRDNFYYLAGRATCDRTALCAAAVIYSNGKRNLGIGTAGIALANGALHNVDEQHNDSSVDSFITGPLETRPDAPGGEFDDLVVWMPASKLVDALKVVKRD